MFLFLSVWGGGGSLEQGFLIFIFLQFCFGGVVDFPGLMLWGEGWGGLGGEGVGGDLLFGEWDEIE